MARESDGSTQFLETSSPPVTTTPFTIACWGKTSDDANGNTLVFLGDNTSPDDRVLLLMAGNVAIDPIRLFHQVTGVGNSSALSTTGYSLSTWHHCCCIEASGQSRSVYIDGGSKGISTTSRTMPTINTMGVLRSSDSTPSAYVFGSIAELGIWNATLTDAEVLSLATGYAPPFIRPESLVFYMPLVGEDDNDLVGGLHLSPDTLANLPTLSEHPPIISQSSPRLFTAPVPVVDLGPNF